MKRIATVTAVLVAASLLALFAAGAGNGSKYLVRAIFDSASFVVEGEDVKVAGVRVGSIDSLDVTEDHKAVVVLSIEDPGYQDFRKDATCKIRPQSLIGEEYVECTPTEERNAGEAPAEPLERIQDGQPGAGQYLLPVERTSAAVDLDLINNVLRYPQRERLRLILGELGVGLAGRGRDLNEVIRRANPALKELDEVLRLLATQNKTLQRLAVDSDTIMRPLARERRRVSSFIEQASDLAEATAERRADLEAGIQRLPGFLRELKPTMVRLGALSDEMTPVIEDLGDVAPDLNRFLLELGPFSRAGTTALKRLGDVAEPGIPALRDSLPIVKDTRRLAKSLRPVAATLNAILTSFKKNDGLERLMDYIYFQATAINGYDNFGHFLRAGLLVNTCSTYTATPIAGCSANFTDTTSRAAMARIANMKMDEVLERTRRVLAGEDPEDVLGEDGKRKRTSSGDEQAAAQAPPTAPSPAIAPETGSGATPTPGSSDPTPTPTPRPSTTEALLDYLLGDGP